MKECSKVQSSTLAIYQDSIKVLSGCDRTKMFHSLHVMCSQLRMSLRLTMFVVETRIRVNHDVINP